FAAAAPTKPVPTIPTFTLVTLAESGHRAVSTGSCLLERLPGTAPSPFRRKGRRPGRRTGRVGRRPAAVRSCDDAGLLQDGDGEDPPRRRVRGRPADGRDPEGRCLDRGAARD